MKLILAKKLLFYQPNHEDMKTLALGGGAGGIALVALISILVLALHRRRGERGIQQGARQDENPYYGEDYYEEENATQVVDNNEDYYAQ